MNGKPWRTNPLGATPQPPKRYVHTYGHRNVQGLAQRKDGSLWSVEHGPTATTRSTSSATAATTAGTRSPATTRSPDDRPVAPGQAVRRPLELGLPHPGHLRCGLGAAAARGGRYNGTLAVAALKANRIVFMKFDRSGHLRSDQVPARPCSTPAGCARSPWRPTRRPAAHHRQRRRRRVILGLAALTRAGGPARGRHVPAPARCRHRRTTGNHSTARPPPPTHPARVRRPPDRATSRQNSTSQTTSSSTTHPPGREQPAAAYRKKPRPSRPCRRTATATPRRGRGRGPPAAASPAGPAASRCRVVPVPPSGSSSHSSLRCSAFSSARPASSRVVGPEPVDRRADVLAVLDPGVLDAVPVLGSCLSQPQPQLHSAP